MPRTNKKESDWQPKKVRLSTLDRFKKKQCNGKSCKTCVIYHMLKSTQDAACKIVRNVKNGDSSYMRLQELETFLNSTGYPVDAASWREEYDDSVDEEENDDDDNEHPFVETVKDSVAEWCEDVQSDGNTGFKNLEKAYKKERKDKKSALELSATPPFTYSRIHTHRRMTGHTEEYEADE